MFRRLSLRLSHSSRLLFAPTQPARLLGVSRDLAGGLEKKWPNTESKEERSWIEPPHTTGHPQKPTAGSTDSKIMDLLIRTAEQGNVRAQCHLGSHYTEEQNFAEAARFYRLAADQGEAGAQGALGLCYYQGRGVTKDFTEAVKLFRLAADQGQVQAQLVLGICCYEGEGTSQDFTEAARLFRIAAEQGNSGAQRYLGVCYAQGQGVPKDLTEAARMFRLAANQGSKDAQFSLGVCYYRGLGVPEDLTEATRLLRLAAAQGHDEARAMLTLVDAGTT